MNLNIQNYSSLWKVGFDNEKKVLNDIFKAEVKAIEHIGSTAIPGLNAKPVIDIFIGLFPFRSLEFYKEKLGKRSYSFVTTGMVNRYLFAKFNSSEIWTHNIHILPYDEGFYSRNEILFRNFLRKKPELIRQYNQLKEYLMAQNPKSLEDYTKGKTSFIQMVVDKIRLEKGLQRQNVWTMEYI